MINLQEKPNRRLPVLDPNPFRDYKRLLKETEIPKENPEEGATYVDFSKKAKESARKYSLKKLKQENPGLNYFTPEYQNKILGGKETTPIDDIDRILQKPKKNS